MRIAYLTQSYPPMISGASIAAEQLAIGMSKHGHEVLVIAASDSGKPYLVRSKNLSVLRLSSIRNPMRVKQRLLIFPHRSMMQALRDFQPDIIHTHEPLQMGLVGLRHARKAGIPILLTAHQLPWFITSYLPDIPTLRSMVERMIWGYARWLTRKFTSVISPTKTITEIIEAKTGVQPATIHYGIDLNVFNPNSSAGEGIEIRTRYHIPDHAPIILHVGRLDVDKHAERVLLSAAEIVKRTKAHLLIVGDGSRKSALMVLSSGLGIESSTHFIGFISDKQELARIYRTANVFVTASEIETQGIVLLEAAACGLPIAAVNATCIPEVVHEGITGYMAESGNIPALSDAITKLLERSSNNKIMQTECCKMAEKYKVESSVERHETHYSYTIGHVHEWLRQAKPVPSKNG